MDAPAEARGEQLHAQAGAPERRPGAHRVGDQALLLREPGELGLIVHTHRAAHRDDQGELAPVGKRVPRVDLDAVDHGAGAEQHVLVIARRLTRDVLEHERAHAGMIPYPEGRF